MDERFVEIAQGLDGICAHHGLDGLDEEQKDALADPVQCFAMLDDLEARCGMDVCGPRIGLSKLHYYVSGSAHFIADLEEVAQVLVDRYKAADGDAAGPDGHVMHAAMSKGASAEYFEPNTGGGVWLSHTVHDAPSGRRLFVTAGYDSVCVYLVPERFDAYEEQAPSGRNTAARMADHINSLCGEDAHMAVATWFYGEE